MLNILRSLVNGTKSMVLGVGKIVSIDLEARDIKIETKTPIRGKVVTSVLHMWKFNGEEYGNNDAWEGRGNWRADTKLAVGNTIFFLGHLGNIKDDKYGRIICTGYGLPSELFTPAPETHVEDEDDEDYDA